MLVDDFQWRGFLIVHQHRRTASSTDAAHQASSRNPASSAGWATPWHGGTTCLGIATAKPDARQAERPYTNDKACARPASFILVETVGLAL
ncbi:MAG: hypothetical protein WC340_16430 [Kiritimatiellia bacterium]